METKTVAIIGAGISGLLACKYTLSKGFIPIVFESRDSVGGVWTEALETTLLQTPKPVYQFSDFPWPETVPEEFPAQHQVLDYVRSYADHFDLLKHIRFNSRVCSIRFEAPCPPKEMEAWSLWGGFGEPFAGGGKWILTVEDTRRTTSSPEEFEVDFVILTVGRFSDVPNIPEFPPNKGPEAFKGEVFHSMEYSAMDFEAAAKLLKGKRVAVVGFQKSALDIAIECYNANGPENPCTILYRSEHWNLPDYLPWGVPLASLYLNRFSELLLHKPGESFPLSLLATFLSPLRWAFSKFVEAYIKKKLGLEKHGMIPSHSFLQEINSCLISTVPEKFYDRVGEGSIILRKSPSFSFCEEGIIIEGETTPIPIDLVIFATGFRGDRKLKQIFSSSAFQDAIFGSEKATLPLYRECIHPRIPQLAVIGFSESVSNLYTSEMRCRWLTELLGGAFRLPSIREMEKEIEKWDVFMKQYSGDNYRRSCIGALHIWYNDQLCKDMGWNPRRKKGFFAELFEPYGPLDYTSP